MRTKQPHEETIQAQHIVTRENAPSQNLHHYPTFSIWVACNATRTNLLRRVPMHVRKPTQRADGYIDSTCETAVQKYQSVWSRSTCFRETACPEATCSLGSRVLHGDDPSSVAAVHDASPVDVGGEEGVRHAHRQHRVADVETRPHLRSQ